MTKQKGIDEFIYASNIISQKYKNVYFAHAGGFPDLDSDDKYIRYLSKKNINNIIWYGYTKNIKMFWSNIDIAVVPSAEPEAFGRVIIEAMVLRKPLIATKSGGPQEIIDDGKNGILIEMQDRKALVNAICRLIDSKKERIKLSETAYEMVKNRFSAKSYSQKMEKFYRSILRK